MAARRQLALLAVLALGAAGCGGLESPDLEHGSVAGQVVGASPGATAYPLGRPDLKVALAADGTFELGHQPVGDVTLVLFDGSTPGRAELVTVTVQPATRSHLLRYGDLASVPEADKMPFSGTVVATAVPLGGGVVTSPSFAVKGTDRVAAAVAGGVAELGPLPPGAFTVIARQSGYLLSETTNPVTVVSGATVIADVPLAVDPDDSAPGCVSSGSQCRNGLRCKQEDGRCYQCLHDSDCGSGTCDEQTWFCNSQGGMNMTVCSVCTSDSQLQCGLTGACIIAPGASSGYCAPMYFGTPCPDQYCPAGFQCVESGGRSLCELPADSTGVRADSCAEYFSEFGEPCFGDQSCGGHGLYGGVCHGADQLTSTPGYCTAACKLDKDCIVPGFVCDSTAKVCVKS